jgi:hypothetical protein
MKKHLKTSSIFLSILLFILTISINQSHAQEYDADGFLINQPKIELRDPDTGHNSSITPTSASYAIDPHNVKTGELASCFDYYTFGSVGINLTTDFGSYDGGDPVMIMGKITNDNAYPLVGLDIKARVVKDSPDADVSRSEIIVLDEFDVTQNITLDAHGEYEVSYSYLLPLNAPSGDYQVLFYAVEQDRFNMSGLSFTNDIIGSKVTFKVAGEQPDHVYLDQTQIMVGDQAHNVMAFMTQHSDHGPIPVTIPLYNSSDQEKEMRVTYTLYSWDGVNPKNIIDTKSEDVVVGAKVERGIGYTIAQPSLPVYYLNIVAEPTDQSKDKSVFNEKTISNIRLVVDGKSKPRLNFVGVNSYPLQDGVEATLVTCFHNTNNIQDPNITKIETVIYDQNKKELSRIEYEGPTIPDITGLVSKFTPKRDISQFTIISTMYDAQGNVIDKVEKIYDCSDLNPGACSASTSSPLFRTLVIVGIILGIGTIIYKRKSINGLRV